jgi:hypothetical protein
MSGAGAGVGAAGAGPLRKLRPAARVPAAAAVSSAGGLGLEAGRREDGLCAPGPAGPRSGLRPAEMSGLRPTGLAEMA